MKAVTSDTQQCDRRDWFVLGPASTHQGGKCRVPDCPPAHRVSPNRTAV